MQAVVVSPNAMGMRYHFPQETNFGQIGVGGVITGIVQAAAQVGTGWLQYELARKQSVQKGWELQKLEQQAKETRAAREAMQAKIQAQLEQDASTVSGATVVAGVPISSTMMIGAGLGIVALILLLRRR